MRNIIGFMFRLVGSLVFYLAGILVLIFIINFLAVEYGFWGVFVGVLFGPVTCIAVPLYAGFALSYWSPLVIILVAPLFMIIMKYFATIIDGVE